MDLRIYGVWSRSSQLVGKYCSIMSRLAITFAVKMEKHLACKPKWNL